MGALVVLVFFLAPLAAAAAAVVGALFVVVVVDLPSSSALVVALAAGAAAVMVGEGITAWIVAVVVVMVWRVAVERPQPPWLLLVAVAAGWWRGAVEAVGVGRREVVRQARRLLRRRWRWRWAPLRRVVGRLLMMMMLLHWRAWWRCLHRWAVARRRWVVLLMV